MRSDAVLTTAAVLSFSDMVTRGVSTIAVPIGPRVVAVDQSTTPAKLVMEDGSSWTTDPTSVEYWQKKLLEVTSV